MEQHNNSSNFTVIFGSSTPNYFFYQSTPEHQDSGYISNVNVSNFPNSTDALNSANSENVSGIEDLQRTYVMDNFDSSHLSLQQSNLIGTQYVDFMYKLNFEHSFPSVTAKILSYLSPKELYNMSKVSHLWNGVIDMFPEFQSKLMRYMNERMQNKENRFVDISNMATPATKLIPFTPRSTFTQRPILGNFQNNRRNRILSEPPTSPKKYRFHLYQKEAEKLPQGERLFTCNLCGLPAQLDPQKLNVVQCTSSNCEYRFCILCHRKEHKSRCDLATSPNSKSWNKYGEIGSAKSRKNLKRLLR